MAASKHSSNFRWVLVLHLVLLSFTQDVQSRSAPSDDSKKGGKQTSFQFLENLVGYQKGQGGKGVHELKQYLEKFGYLNYGMDGSHEDFDFFDNVLESAIKTYQLSYNLNVTGFLNTETASHMMVPRCGVPDNVHRWKHNNNPSNLHFVSLFSFFNGNPKWPSDKTHLTFGFLPDGVQVIAINDLRAVCSKAFARWSAVSRFTFQEIDDAYSADIKIGFYKGDHGDGLPFDGPGNILAHSFAPTRGKCHFDAEEDWEVHLSSNDAFDLESVATHEFGHLLGLGHSSVQDAIMYPYILPGTRKVNLNEDDIEGIRVLYNLF